MLTAMSRNWKAPTFQLGDWADGNMPAPAGWAPSGFAAIPTTAIDPPHSAASPAVPALVGPGPLEPTRRKRAGQQLSCDCGLHFGDLTELS